MPKEYRNKYGGFTNKIYSNPFTADLCGIRGTVLPVPMQNSNLAYLYACMIVYVTAKQWCRQGVYEALILEIFIKMTRRK